jgi:hypothetical protein
LPPPCSAAGVHPRPTSDPATPGCLPSDPRSGRALPAAVPGEPIHRARWDWGDASHIPDVDRVGGSSLAVQAKQIEPSRCSPSPQRRTIGDRSQAPSAPGARVGVQEQGVGSVHLLEGRALTCRCLPSSWSFDTPVSPVTRSLGSPAAPAE